MLRFTLLLALLACLVLGLGVSEDGGAVVFGRNAGPGNLSKNRFAIDLYRKVRERPGNVSVSPTSVSNALSMTYEGARGETAGEMVRVLGLPADREAMRAEVRASLGRLNGDGSPRPYRLVAANGLWSRKGEPLRPEYLKEVAATYGATAEALDFQGDAEGSRRTINAWVDGRTEHMISELIQPADLNPSPSLILVNTLYFKGTWSNPFPAASTTPADFHASGGKAVSLPFMRQTASLPYAEARGLQVLEMPYAGGDYAMLVVLPKAVDGLDALERSLTTDDLDGWVKSLAPRRVAVELPRFKVKTGVELSAALSAMGMPTAFTSSADFSGIDGRRDLTISKVIHQVVVDVNEQGTEAAAATAVMMPRSMAVRPAPPVSFRADRPFLYLIRDVKTGEILFLGRIAEPTS